MKSTASRVAWSLTCLLVLGVWGAQAQQLGDITFATSGAPAAQSAFLQGVKQLHSFQFDEAAVAFKQAQAEDAGFALAYWGEAMSYNHPLWAQVDVAKAKQALERLAPTAEGRAAKAGTPKEKAYLAAVEMLFYGEGDKLARDSAYSKAMERMHAQWPDDHEVAIFYALSLLGTVRPGDTGFRRQALAASIALKVFQDNPNHPGAAHFIIHAFDDPDHAILALPAAQVYAKIAPSAAHALHMPSHIFLQLGMWDGVRTSNIAAYKAAYDLNMRMRLPEGREDFHALSWLTYANLMLGRFDDAKANVELARQAAERNEGSQGVRNGYLGMRARYILETGQWEKIALDAPAMTGHDDHAGMPGMPSMANAASYDSAAWTFVAGLSAAKLGDDATAEKAQAQLRAMAERARAGGDAYAAKPMEIMEKEVSSAISLARGQRDQAVQLAKQAADVEVAMDAPSGPPQPIKPALEFYGDVLLEAGRAREAAAAYEQQLLRTPNRTPSVKGLAKARGQAPAPSAAAQ